MPKKGGLLAKKQASVLGNYFLMVMEWNHLSKDVPGLRKDIRKLNGHVRDHDLEKIQVDMKTVDDKILKSGEEGYKLGYRDLLLLRRSIINLRAIAGTVHKNMELVEEAERKIVKGIGDRKAAKKLTAGIKKAEDVDDFTKREVGRLIAEAHDDMKGMRKAGYDLEVTAKGRQGMGLVMKGNAEGFFRHMQIRFGALRDLKKSLREEIKQKGRAKVALTRLRQTTERQLAMVNGHNAKLEDLQKGVEADEKDTEEIMTDLRIVFDKTGNVIKATYKIFIFDVMLLKAVVTILAEGFSRDKKLMEAHEIPRQMGYNDVKALEKDRANIEDHLQNLEKFLLQLWNV